MGWTFDSANAFSCGDCLLFNVKKILIFLLTIILKFFLLRNTTNQLAKMKRAQFASEMKEKKKAEKSE
ncbi:hypothetical protein HK096_011424 [Nowakowskiella sp. JEL0078]|nr:hypothetical protein HK096_011424 [Nowakowskiella sp. JEL0078]